MIMDEPSEQLERLRSRVETLTADEQERIDFAVLAGRNQDQKSRPLLYALLDDPSEDVRYYAVRALVLDAVDRGSAAEGRCWQLFDGDQSSRVRAMAAACLGSLHAHSKDRTAFMKLKEGIARATDSWEAEASLEALYHVLGRPPREWPAQRRILSGQSDATRDTAALLDEAADLERRYLRFAPDHT